MERKPKKKPNEPVPDVENLAKNPHAQSLGKFGRLKGGKAREKMLTPKQRRRL